MNRHSKRRVQTTRDNQKPQNVLASPVRSAALKGSQNQNYKSFEEHTVKAQPYWFEICLENFKQN